MAREKKTGLTPNGRRIPLSGKRKTEYITNLSEIIPTYFAPEFREDGESCKYNWLDTSEHFEKLKWHRVFATLPTDAQMAEILANLDSDDIDYISR